MEWSDSWRGAFRVELRAQAIGLAWRGWPVLPGTYPAGSHWAGRELPEHTGPHPVHDDWQARVGTEPEQVASWWSGRPYSVLLATGVTFDAIEVPGDLGRGAARELRTVGLPVPIIATPDDRWTFLVTTGRPLARTLADHPDVVLHADGDYVPLPPTPVRHGVVHWRVNPEVCGWQIPASSTVQDALLDALARETVARPVADLVTAD
ncbi:bifunctional DNA primase/polymerase [Actinophytocola sp. S1-96]|uniref:Bifunctional DNA primase/polymerase n=2 Tax=Actinophytocola gossypii TaxID=2812003 RepID=A0ABT2J3S9_9PSEU|nr:bifunctional DNA primase/polymerase [Actinophytocola gossypii]